MYAINSLAMTLVDRGEYLRARALLVEGLALVRRLENKEQLVYYLEAFAWIAAPLAAARGQPHEGALRAARLFGAAEALGEAIGGPLSTVERAMHARHLAAARAHVDAASWESALAEGRAMAPEQAIEYALEDDGQRG
jgi:hypothetical protein